MRILYSVESGSRARGFASSDSDYDVRFIYVRCMEDYLRLDSVRDVIEREPASLESAAASMEKDRPVGYETLNKAFLAILRGAVPK